MTQGFRKGIRKMAIATATEPGKDTWKGRGRNRLPGKVSEKVCVLRVEEERTSIIRRKKIYV